MAKKTTKKTTTAKSVELPERLDAPGGGELVSAFDLASPAGLDQVLGDHGVSREHVGGSFPLIKFGSRPVAFVARFLGISDAAGEADDYTFCLWQVFDAAKLFSGKFPEEACRVGKAQTVNGRALQEWTSILGEPDKKGKRPVVSANEENVGKLVAVKYLGQTDTKRGQNPFKVVTIEELTLPKAKGK